MSNRHACAPYELAPSTSGGYQRSRSAVSHDEALDGTDGALDGTDEALDRIDETLDGTDEALDGTDEALDGTDESPDGTMRPMRLMRSMPMTRWLLTRSKPRRHVGEINPTTGAVTILATIPRATAMEVFD